MSPKTEILEKHSWKNLYRSKQTIWLVRLISMWRGFENYFQYRVTKVMFLKSCESYLCIWGGQTAALFWLGVSAKEITFYFGCKEIWEVNKPFDELRIYCLYKVSNNGERTWLCYGQSPPGVEVFADVTHISVNSEWWVFSLDFFLFLAVAQQNLSDPGEILWNVRWRYCAHLWVNTFRSTHVRVKSSLIPLPEVADVSVKYVLKGTEKVKH